MMKMSRYWAVSLIFAAALAGCGGGSGIKILFFDDFSDASLSRWSKTASMGAQVQNGVLHITCPGLFGFMYAVPTLQARNYVCEVEGRATANQDGYAVVFRATPLGDGAPAGYGFQYDPGAGGLKLPRYPDVSGDTDLRPLVERNLDTGWHRLRVEARGNSFRCYMDDSLIFDFTDDEYPVGGMGLRVWGGEAQIRSVRVTALPD